MVDEIGTLKVENSEEIISFDCRVKTDDALRFVTYFTFRPLHLLVLSYSRYSEGEGQS